MRSSTLIMTAATIAGLSGCVIVTEDVNTAPGPVFNTAPIVTSADAFCVYDRSYSDDIWDFSATVDDYDGVYDVVQVWADVYDEYAGGTLIESFELYPTNDPYLWWSDWLGRTTLLDPYYDGYTVDLVAYDSFNEFGVTTIWLDTYGN